MAEPPFALEGREDAATIHRRGVDPPRRLLNGPQARAAHPCCSLVGAVEPPQESLSLAAPPHHGGHLDAEPLGERAGRDIAHHHLDRDDLDLLDQLLAHVEAAHEMRRDADFPELEFFQV